VTSLDLEPSSGLRAAPRARGEGGIGPESRHRHRRAACCGGRTSAGPGRLPAARLRRAEADSLVPRFSGAAHSASYARSARRGIASPRFGRAVRLRTATSRPPSSPACSAELKLARWYWPFGPSSPTLPLNRSAGGAARSGLLPPIPHVVGCVAGHTHRNEILRRGSVWLITTSTSSTSRSSPRVRLVAHAGARL